MCVWGRCGEKEEPPISHRPVPSTGSKAECGIAAGPIQAIWLLGGEAVFLKGPQLNDRLTSLTVLGWPEVLLH